MATGSYVINRAYRKMGIRDEEESISAAQLVDGLADLNDMLSSWEPVYQLGFVRLDSADDKLRVPSFAVSAIITSLAVYLGSSNGIPVRDSLAAEAIAARNAMEIGLSEPIVAEYPSTLPLGSGNELPGYGDDQRFFPENDKVNF
jgi:hypothetical protein